MKTSMTAEPATYPPIHCQPWCTQQDGHPGHRFREDQVCESEVRVVDLATPQPVDSFGDRPERLWVYAQTAPGDGLQVHVCLEDAPGITLTPDEARQVIDGLQAVLSILEDGAR